MLGENQKKTRKLLDDSSNFFTFHPKGRDSPLEPQLILSCLLLMGTIRKHSNRGPRKLLRKFVNFDHWTNGHPDNFFLKLTVDISTLIGPSPSISTPIAQKKITRFYRLLKVSLLLKPFISGPLKIMIKRKVNI